VVNVWYITAVNKAYKLFEDEEQVKYCETIVEEARSQLETKVCVFVKSVKYILNIEAIFGSY